jgi:hypothetical protein
MDHSQAKRYAISCIVKYIETFTDTDPFVVIRSEMRQFDARGLKKVFDFLSESDKNKIDGAMLDLRESLKPHGLTESDISELGDKAQFMVE